MISTNLLEESSARSISFQKGPYSVIEYERDISTSPQAAEEAYFASKMNIRKRQLVITLPNDNGVYIQAGDLQLMLGDIDASSNINGAGDFLKKLVTSVVTDETVVKPFYRGTGTLVLEPTYKYIIVEDLADWPDGLVIEDGMFLACDEDVRMEIVSRRSISSMAFGGEGLFNTSLFGEGLVALECPVPMDELIVVNLEDDTVKIDGNMAIAWSPELRFTVQKSTSTLVGSFISGEGLVNVYEGTGKVLIAPVRVDKGIPVPEKPNK